MILPSHAQEQPQVTLITSVNVFDGVDEKLIKNANVVVTDNLITAVSTEPLAVAGGRVIDGGGRTKIPGRHRRALAHDDGGNPPELHPVS